MTIDRDKVVRAAANCIANMKNWAESAHYSTALKYQTQAEVLIEILEEDDCGSVGGFDKSNPVQRESGSPLTDRLYAVARKYAHRHVVDEELERVSGKEVSK